MMRLFPAANQAVNFSRFQMRIEGYGYTFVTANTKDFKNIDGLQFVNWVE